MLVLQSLFFGSGTRISHNYQVLLDDGNRIIIPQGNFNFFVCELQNIADLLCLRRRPEQTLMSPDRMILYDKMFPCTTKTRFTKL